MAALYGQHQSPYDLIVTNMRVILNDVINKLESRDSVDYARYRVDWLCSLLLRLGGNLETSLLPGVLEAQRMLAMLDSDIYCAEREESISPAKISTGLKGRQEVDIPKDHLECLLDLGFKAADIGRMLGVSPKTIHRRLKKFDLSMQGTYSDISDSSLDSLVTAILHEFPNSGYRAMRGQLLSRGLKVQEHRVRASMRRTDPEGIIVRALQMRITHRRSYNVRAPLSLWHIDGNHKLVRY